MGAYIAKRLLYTIPVLFGVVLVVFILLRLIPGDPIALYYFGSDATQSTGSTATAGVTLDLLEQLRATYNLDKSIPHQFALYVADILQGDLGQSIRTRRDVTEIIAEHWPATIQLTMAGMAVALLIGIGAGIISAVRRHTWVDYGAQVFAVLGVSIPNFWLGLILVWIFAIVLGWLPAISNGHGKELILPSITLGTAAAAILARLTRSSMLDVLSRDYVRTARAKGLRERSVVWIHALRNALIPVITIIGLEFGGLLAGSVVVEVVFLRQGLGFQLIDSISNRDYPVVQALVLMAAVLYAVANLIVDILYTYIDPRVRLIRAEVG